MVGLYGKLNRDTLLPVPLIYSQCQVRPFSGSTAVHDGYLDDLAASDEISGGTISDQASTLANITDITVNYGPAHPPPQVRLRHGQTLQQSYLSPMDTCVGP